jgi:hypothetical protein
MAMLVSTLWIIFDVLICLRTGYMTQPFPRWEWWTWLLAGLALALFAIIADWLRQRNEKRERAQERLVDHPDGFKSREATGTRQFGSSLQRIQSFLDWLVERSEFELPVPVSKLSDDSVVL